MLIDTDTKYFSTLSEPASKVGSFLYKQLFRAYGENAVFLPISCPDATAAFSSCRALGFSGLTASMPHKGRALELVDHVDSKARAIGAVNTIVFRGGLSTGYNTDWFGAVAALQDVTPLRDKRVLLLGAGGAARAIAHGILGEGARLTILNRTPARLGWLTDQAEVQQGMLSELDKAIDDCEIVINATSVGFLGGNANPEFARVRFRPAHVLLDAVFDPVETDLMKAARRAGAIAIPGAAMLVHQGRMQCQLWFGRKLDDWAPVQAALSDFLIAQAARTGQAAA